MFCLWLLHSAHVKIAIAENVDVDFLISLVEARLVLWDETKEGFREKHLKTDAWKEVCRIIFPLFDEKDHKEKTKLGKDIRIYLLQ